MSQIARLFELRAPYESLRSEREQFQHGSRRQPLPLIALHQNSRTTKLVDKLFSLQGLTNGKACPLSVIDFQKAPHKPFSERVRLYSTSQRDLDLLEYTTGLDINNLALFSLITQWFPYLSKQQTRLPLTHATEIADWTHPFTAARYSFFTPQSSEDPRVLLLKCYGIDEVQLNLVPTESNTVKFAMRPREIPKQPAGLFG